VIRTAGLCAFLAAAAWAVPGARQTSCECPRSRQFPSGAADVDAGLAFIANPENGVSAVQLVSGSIAWESSSASLPVGVVDAGVVALRRGEDPREVQPVLLDRRTGAPKVTGRSFRPGRDLLSDRALGATLFSVEEKDAIVVRWRDVAADTRGPEQITGRSIENGGFRLSRDGAVEPLALEVTSRELTRAAGTPYQRGSEQTSGTWGDGPCARSLVSEQQDEQIVLRLCIHSAPSADADKRRELARSKSLAVSVSLDGCSIFVETVTDAGRSWRVFSSADGEPLGRIPREAGAWNPAASASAAYYLVDGATTDRRTRTSLRAIDLKTGQKRWEIPVRSRSSAGPDR
jgi:hypothetical protein